jgi:nucleoside 2-deoxyribosyltransferase
MKYVEPSVKLIDNSTPELGYFLWLKSRQWVIEDLDGKKFMVDMYPEYDWLCLVPTRFKVGGELVDKREYLNRINKMNLQYNNLENYVFEINGSCLFRDILFNVNKIGMWAQSNRFLFSILGEGAREDENNYAVSAEYKGIPEWEAQFETYMKAIKEDPIVDHNRLEMPYSISSTFWVCINKKTMYDFLSFLRLSAPYFYNVYGKLFTKGIADERLIPSVPSAAITQYIMKDAENYKQGSWNIQGTQIVNSDMALILYSQFIRQADTLVSGFYNEIIHTDADEFSHRVFKGGTIIKTHYVADIDKALSTVRTRLCAFAMSSGDGPESWSHFINNFLPENLEPKEFMKMLPCKFSGCKLIECKFHDDIKFRNEGKEVSNCPCPIYSKSMADAESKKSRDNNKIGDAFHDLTEYLNNGGFKYKWEIEKWTSKLSILTERELDQGDKAYIEWLLDNLEEDYNSKEYVNETRHDRLAELYHKRKDMFPDGDITCAMKGLAIDWIASYFTSPIDEGGVELNHKSFIINFGGDIYVHNAFPIVHVDGTKFNIDLCTGEYWSIFTSGNTTKRGNHILGCPEDYFITQVIRWSDAKSVNNVVADILATKTAAQESIAVKELSEEIYGRRSVLEFSSDGTLLSTVYCASPFFNPEQVKVRDAMVSVAAKSFRPDLTPESEKYNVQKDYDAVCEVVKANIDGIHYSDYLMFPNRTTDLGTLWEVGRAIGVGKPIIKYDEKSDEYTVVYSIEPAYPDSEQLSKSMVFDCTSKVDVISMGFLSLLVPQENLYYQLKGMPDNIMLSVNYHHIEFEGEYAIEYERNKEDEDK